MTLRTWNGVSKYVKAEAKNLPVGVYGIYINGSLDGRSEVIAEGDTVKIAVHVSEIDTDVVVRRANESIKKRKTGQ